MRIIKFLLLSTIPFLISFNCFSQSKIDGIGIFKIDKTNIKIIDSLSKNGYELKTCSDSYNCSHYNVKGMNIYEKINDSTKYDISLPIIKENKTFIIGEYFVAGINIKNLELNFYNGILFEIKSSENIELQSALNEKYNGTIKSNKKEITCRSIYGEFKEEEVTYTTTYRNDEKINAYSVLHIYFDKKCKKNTLNYLIISNVKIAKEVESKTNNFLIKIKEKEKKEKKAQLNKL